MSILDRLERPLGRFALPHLTIVLIVCQASAYAYSIARPEVGLADRIYLVGDKVIAGESWRLATFLIAPPFGSIICLLFFWYLFYLFGTALEQFWGVFRYNVYLLTGYLCTVAASFIAPSSPFAAGFFQSSVLLAFAQLCPDFPICLFFLVTIRIKWLALFLWVTNLLLLVFGDWFLRSIALASIGSALLFFGKDIAVAAWIKARWAFRKAIRARPAKMPVYHRCAVCGITDRTRPQVEFRYCSQCAGARGFCPEHLRNHEHVLTGS